MTDLWDHGRVAAHAAEEIPRLIDRVTVAADARAALLLGLIAEGDPGPGVEEARVAVRAGVPRVLDLLDGAARERGALRLAVLFLLAHFPEDRVAILTRAAGAGAESAEDWRRVERALHLQTAAGADPSGHLRLLWPSRPAMPPDRAWRAVVRSVLAPLGAEAAHLMDRG